MAIPAPPLNREDTTEYLSALEKRISSLDEETKRLLADLQTREERLGKAHADLVATIGKTGAEVRRVEEELAAFVQQIRSLVASFQNSARRQEMARLQQRVDGQRYEEFLTKDEFKRLIDEEFANG